MRLGFAEIRVSGNRNKNNKGKLFVVRDGDRKREIETEIFRVREGTNRSLLFTKTSARI